MLPRPRTDQPHYGAHLGDPGYWGPYVEVALRDSGLAVGRVEAPFVGTFPTFLVGEVVVKLFGETFDGKASYAAEAAVQNMLAGHSEIPSPALVAKGELFPEGTGWSWPYLVTERLSGQPIRVFDRSGPGLTPVADRLGEVVARLHQLDAPPVVAERDLIPGLRRSAPDRLAQVGLPPRLVEQVSDYLIDAPAPSVLVHADITDDHVFLHGGGLQAIIDWGDAIVASPYYEFVAVYLDALGGSRELLGRFLASYGLDRDGQFPVHALQALLEFQFDAVTRVKELVNLDSVRELDELAERLFGS